MLEYWLWLSGRRGLGVRGLRALLEQFGTPEAVYCASDAEYPSDIRPDGRTSLADKELAPARQILQQCYRQCIHIVTLQDAVYPQRLKNIDDAPLVLYYQGVLPDFDAEPVIAMVGTRRASAYGLLQAKRLGYELGRYGAIVVSGGAAGIDTLALRGAVSSGTPPVAVFACAAVAVTTVQGNLALWPQTQADPVIAEVGQFIQENTQPDEGIAIGVNNPSYLNAANRRGYRANIAYYDYIPTGPEAEVTYFIEHGVRWFVVVQGWVYNDEDGAYRTYLREQFPVAATGTNCVIYDLQGE